MPSTATRLPLGLDRKKLLDLCWLARSRLVIFTGYRGADSVADVIHCELLIADVLRRRSVTRRGDVANLEIYVGQL